MIVDSELKKRLNSFNLLLKFIHYSIVPNFTKMEVRYKSKATRLYRNLGIFLIIINIVYLIVLYTENDNFHWSYFSNLFLGSLFLAYSAFMSHKPYVKIENGAISSYEPLKKEILFSEITEIKKFAGDIKIIAGEKEIIVSKDLVDENSMEKLESYLNELNLDSIKGVKIIPSI